MSDLERMSKLSEKQLVILNGELCDCQRISDPRDIEKVIHQ